MDDAHAMVAKAAFGQGGMDIAPITDEVKGADFFISLKCALGSFDDDPATVVATHDIHCDSHKDGPCDNRAAARWNWSSSGSYSNDLASFIIATGRTSPMRHVGSGALRTGAELRQSQNAVVSAAHALTTFRRFSLGDTHNNTLNC